MITNREGAMRIAIALVALLLTGCATMSDVQDAQSIQGEERIFSGSSDVVSAAALKAVHRINVIVKETRQTGAAFEIYFSKAITGFSWGEVGKVSVTGLDDDNSVVVVTAQKRMKTQVTGTDQAEFAATIFEGISQELSR